MSSGFFILQGGIVAVLGLLISAALFSQRRNRLANRLLGAVLLCSLFRQALLLSKLMGWRDLHPSWIRVSFPLELVTLPLLYLYVQAMTTPMFRLRRGHAVHLLPFCFGVVWYLAFLLFADQSLFQSGPALQWERYLRLIVKVAILFPYLFAVRRLVLSFGARVAQRLSNVSHLKLQWLSVLLVIIYAVLFLDLIQVLQGPQSLVWRWTPTWALLSYMALAFFSMRVSAVFADELRAEVAEDNPDGLKDGPAGRNSVLPDDKLNYYKEKLQRLLDEDTCHLDPELRASDLAAKLGVRPYRLSEVINRGFGCTFYDLINKHRIERAKHLMAGKDGAHLNLLGIAFDSGFKSKSVFNDAFKKITGMTPSEYRSQSQAD